MALPERTFIQPPALAKVSKALRPVADKSIAFLESIVADDKQDIKYRIDVAKFVVEKSIQATSEAGKESIIRLTQELKREERLRPTRNEDEEGGNGKVVYVTSEIVDLDKDTSKPDSFADVGNLNKL